MEKQTPARVDGCYLAVVHTETKNGPTGTTAWYIHLVDRRLYTSMNASFRVDLQYDQYRVALWGSTGWQFVLVVRDAESPEQAARTAWMIIHGT